MVDSRCFSQWSGESTWWTTFGSGLKRLPPIVWSLVGDVFPARAVCMAGGAVNTVSNASGIVTTVGIGYLYAATGSFDSALWWLAGHAVLALASHALLVRRVVPIKLEPALAA